MTTLIVIGSFLVANWATILAAIVAVILALAGLCTALAGLFLMIPGTQPEGFLNAAGSFLKGLADTLAPYSKK